MEENKKEKKPSKLKQKVGSFFTDFKAFISRGNVVDMAVGVIIASAFSAIVTALTNKIIMPLINWLLSIGGENGLEKAYTFLRIVRDSENQIDLTKSIYIDWGAFITAIINFFLIALVLFAILKTMISARKATESLNHATNKDVRAERKAVKIKAKEEGKAFKLAWSEHLAEKERLAKEKAEQELANAPKVETQEEILKDIRALLQAQNANAVKKEEK